MADILGDAATGATLGSVIPGVGTLIGGLGGAAIGIASGLFGRKKAKQTLAQSPYPTQEMPSEITENQQIARGAAIEGMPAEQYAQAQKNIQRNQAAALAAAQDRRSGVQSIGAIQQQSDDASNQLAGQSAEMRRQNISQLLGVNQQAASWKDKLFDWNQKQKYIQQYNYGMGLLGQSNQNLLSGADRALGTIAGAVSSGMFSRSPSPEVMGNVTPPALSYQPGRAAIPGSGPGNPIYAPPLIPS